MQMTDCIVVSFLMCVLTGFDLYMNVRVNNLVFCTLMKFIFIISCVMYCMLGVEY